MNRPSHLVRVAVPRLNKQDRIGDYLRQLDARDYDLNWAEVTETVTLDCARWNELMTSLLEDRDWLAGKGGCNSWAEVSGDDFFKLTEAEQKEWKRCAYILVVAVVAPTGSVVYIDPQGYDYARYVAFPASGLPEGQRREELREEWERAEQAARDAELAKRVTNPAPLRTVARQECAKMIRVALKQAFPCTKFSVKGSSYSMGHSIDVSWVDGPIGAQVKPILDRFESRGFDGMTDCSYSCGARILCGARVTVDGGYVRGSRSESQALRAKVAERLARECGLEFEGFDEYGNLKGGDRIVPFQFHSHWHKDADGKETTFTVEEIETAKYILAGDSHGGEWFSQLCYRVMRMVSMEEAKPIAPELLPEYIDIHATVSTGRAESLEPRQKMFESHAALETETAAWASFEGKAN